VTRNSTLLSGDTIISTGASSSASTARVFGGFARSAVRVRLATSATTRTSGVVAPLPSVTCDGAATFLSGGWSALDATSITPIWGADESTKYAVLRSAPNVRPWGEPVSASVDACVGLAALTSQ